MLLLTHGVQRSLTGTCAELKLNSSEAIRTTEHCSLASLFLFPVFFSFSASALISPLLCLIRFPFPIVFLNPFFQSDSACWYQHHQLSLPCTYISSTFFIKKIKIRVGMTYTKPSVSAFMVKKVQSIWLLQNIAEIICWLSICFTTKTLFNNGLFETLSPIFVIQCWFGLLPKTWLLFLSMLKIL